MKISILIAVYNAEATLRRCLDSLEGQTYPDVEIVAADDASTDHSLDILRDYETEYENIRVVEMPRNGGCAKARNAALAIATGDIIMFTDSDDWLAADAVERVMRTFAAHPQTDSVLLDCCYLYPDGRREFFAMPAFDRLTGQEAFELSLDWTIHGVYAVRAGIHRAHPYDETCSTYSDDMSPASTISVVVRCDLAREFTIMSRIPSRLPIR